MPNVRATVRGPIAEISADPALRTYGVALAWVHVLVFLEWRLLQDVSAILSPAADAICWPFFERCQDWRLLSSDGVRAVLWVYLAVGVASGVLFALDRVRGAWWLYLAATAMQLAILAQDYRLRLNQHYMALWVAAVFLVVPGRRRVLQYLIVAFYVAAGLLKLNGDWLSGATLLGRRPLFVPPSLVPVACAYVVVLELVVVFGLLARRDRVFWAAYGQILLFHLTSWTVVDFFYPTLMFGLLAIFPLARVYPDTERPSVGAFFGGRERWPAYATVAVFAACQLLPRAYPGDTALTGEGRLFALHMFDAPVVCEATAIVHDAGQTTTTALFTVTPARIRCDPIVYLSLARGLCRRLAAKPGFEDLDVRLRSRHMTRPELRTVVAVDGFCRATPHYTLWRHNDWIHAD